MTTSTLVQKLNKAAEKQGPVVVLPINLWEEIQDRLEDLEMLAAKGLKNDIAESRKDVKLGKIVSLEDL